MVAASADCLKVHANRADITRINIGLVVRAAARIERLAKIRHVSGLLQNCFCAFTTGQSPWPDDAGL